MPTKIKHPSSEATKPTVSLEQLERHKADLQAELSQLRVQDTTEKAELRVEIAKLSDYIEKQQKADAERDKISGSTNTIVIPPKDIPAQQPSTGNQAPTTSTSERKGFLKGWW